MPDFKRLEGGRSPFFPISVNASVQSLHSAETLNSLLNIVTKYAVLPSFIQVEMTEMAYVENGELTQKAIQFLHDAGFSVILDNFGCGYASLNMLKELKYDAIKLDMRFMPIKDKTENDEIMLASLIKMTNWMGMSVIAEAVENRRQKDFLMAAGCDCAQGFLFGEPVAREDYEERYISTLLQSNAQLSMGEFGDDTKHNMTILIIDDEELSRDLLKSIFAGLYHIHTCSNAEDGLLYLKHNKGKVKLILVDNFMPGMGGMDFLRFCKQDPALAMIPQIMITTSDDDVDQLKAFHEGAYDYITKPYTKEVVMARVNHVMEISCRTSIFDIIEQKYRQQPELDAATALLNKMAFVDLSSRVLDIFPDERQALLVIDVDDFKQVNDKHGHLVGDKVIRCIADEMTNSFRKTDVVGRFGGDEFVVLMTKIHGLEIAKSKAVELIKAIMVSCTRKFGISISISISTCNCISVSVSSFITSLILGWLLAALQGKAVGICQNVDGFAPLYSILADELGNSVTQGCREPLGRPLDDFLNVLGRQGLKVNLRTAGAQGWIDGGGVTGSGANQHEISRCPFLKELPDVRRHLVICRVIVG